MKDEEMIKDIKEVQPFFYGNIAEMFIEKGYRKESDTAKEICDLILEYWEVDDFVDCNWLIEVIREKYGVDLGE